MRHIDLSLLDPTKEPLKKWIVAANANLKTAKNETDCAKRKVFIQKNPYWTKIKKHLSDKYGGKCWYSECDLTGHDGDVDHFRPKGRSKDINGVTILEDGYWWLAYEYTNYRISCTHCNQARKDEITGKTQGKSDCFPLATGTTPLKINDNISTEKQMLLDPTNKDDVNLLSFDVTGKAISLTLDTIQKQRVTESINIYHLDEQGFEKNRKVVWAECEALLDIFSVGCTLAEPNNKILMEATITSLKEKVKTEALYSATAIACIKLHSEGKFWRCKLLESLNIE